VSESVVDDERDATVSVFRHFRFALGIGISSLSHDSDCAIVNGIVTETVNAHACVSQVNASSLVTLTFLSSISPPLQQRERERERDRDCDLDRDRDTDGDGERLRRRCLRFFGDFDGGAFVGVEGVAFLPFLERERRDFDLLCLPLATFLD